MRRLISYWIIFSLTITILPAQNTNVVITGNLKMDTLYNTIYVENFDRRPKMVDSTTIDPQGGFYLDFPVKSLEFLKLKLDPENYLILIILPGENIRITSEAGAIARNPVIEGSPQSLLLRSLSQEVRHFEARMDSLHKQAVLAASADSSGNNGHSIHMVEYRQADSACKAYLKSFFEMNPSSPACLFYSNRLSMDEYFETFSLLDDSLYVRYPKNPYVRELHYAVTSRRYIRPGLVAPNIVASTPEGDSAALYDLRGKVVLVDFWAAWCGPCRRENPNVVAMYNKYHDAGFDVFGVSLDEKRENWLKAIEDDSLTWTQVSDLRKWESVPAMTYAVRSIPFSVLLDREGRIIARELRGSALRSKLEEIFGF
ncbi:MAG: TlpA disulfide reductase family protein [Bacteroidales bacterium]|nr:AhpC/TSA family protein [Lentimicrobiaceae bacterium]MDD5695646.1 TlpA disulfide reductase family protein [Bacteroidales bacterium]